MKRLGVMMLVVVVAFAAAVGTGEARWKKRGWYVKQPGANCVLRLVKVVAPKGKVSVRTVRVCR